MEFRFDLNEIFQQPIVEIGNSLIPPGFSGDKRALWDTQSKVTQIVNAMGESSAHAQGLSKPITTADRLRNSEHRLYLLIDHSANNGKGAVTGMLKTGEKGLYVFDRDGQHYQVSPPCVLDFYIHESRQRSGFGKRLFEHMLQREQIEPVKMAIDRPSEKFLGFLNKHYGLNSPVKQMNNYVVFDGFFPRTSEGARTIETDKSYTPSKKQSANGLQQGFPSSPYGRYAAPRPPCSMGQIIHNDSPVIKRNQEPTGVRSEPVTNLHGQDNYYYAQGNPAWQGAQSVPNMQHQNAYNNYNQNGMMNYQASGGDFDRAHPCNQPNPHVNNLIYGMAQGDATYQSSNTDTNSIHYPGQNQLQNELRQPVKSKEPLIPQSFDGTLRKTPHTTQSVPAQSGENNNPPILLQNSASSPVNYQQQPVFLQQNNEAIVPGANLIKNLPNGNYQQQYLENQPSIIHRDSQQAVPLQYQNQAGHPPTSQELEVNQQQPKHGLQSHTGPQNQAQYHVAYLNQVQNPVMPQSSVTHLANQEGNYQPPSAMTHNIQQNPNYVVPNQLTQQIPNRFEDARGQSQNAYPTNLIAHNTTNQQQAPNFHPVIGQVASNQNDGVSAQSAYQRGPEMLTHNLSYNQHMLSNSSQEVAPNTHNVMGQVVSNRNDAVHGQFTNQRGSEVLTDNLPYSHHMPNAFNQKDAINVQSANQSGPGQVLSIPEVAPPSSPYNQFIPSKYPASQQQAYNMHHAIGQVASTVSMNQKVAVNDRYANQMVPQQVQSVPEVGPPNLSYNQHIPSNSTQNIPASIVPESVHASQSENRRTMIDSRTGIDDNLRPIQEVDLTKGYPPQHYEKTTQNSTAPKADRPNSLNIEPADEADGQPTNANDVKPETTEAVSDHGDRGDVDSLDGDAIDAIEREIRKVEVAPESPRGAKSPGIEAAGIVTPGRSTPGLTDQGYFDLKFYHNKLW